MIFPTPKIVKLADVNIATYQAGPKDGVPLLLIHGWPEIAYSWSRQIGPLSQAGYRVIAVDVRGFGNSSAPKEKQAYGIEKLVGDIEGVLDALDIEKAVICGHDWGGIIVWHAARMIANRVTAVISICTPHVKRPPISPIPIFKHRHGDDHYFVAFQKPDEAEELFAQNPDAFFRMMFRTVPKGSKPSSEMYHLMKKFKEYLAAGAPELPGQVMEASDRQVYIDAYANSGFRGGVNLYRNTDENWEYDKSLGETVSQPSLMISAAQDLFLPPEFADQMVDMVPDLERHTVDNCGHWAMWEQPEAINAIMIDWLGRKF